jgi:outer membrane receptor for ferrienterochelin and colicins
MHARLTPLRLTVLATALGAAMPALGQAVAARSVAPVLQKVEIKGAADGYDARRDDTASKIVLNHDEIVKYGDTTVLDVLKRLPGVTVSGAAGRGGEIRMRGLGSGYTQILINGERAPAGFSMDSLAPDSIERIEVMRAATAELSTQSIAGTINIILKKAIKSAQREMKAGIGGGKGLFAPTYNVQLSDRRDQLSYSLAVNAFHHGFKRDTPTLEYGIGPDGNALLRNSSFHEDGVFDGINIGPRLNWTFANGDTLTSQSFVNVGRFARTSESVSVASVGVPAPYPFIEWDTVFENRFFRSDLNWVKKLAGSAKLDLKIGGVIGALRNDSYRNGYQAPGGTQTLDNYVRSRGTDTGVTTTAKISTPVGKGHALAMGWDGGYSARDDSRIQREWRLATTASGPVRVAGDSDEEYTADVERLAVYAQDEWNVTPRWSVYLGLRWEGIRTSVTGNLLLDTRTRTSVWSPLFQTLYKLPNMKDQLRFALTRTYKAPATQSIIPRRFTTANNNSTEPDFQGNPNLRPELALGLDASYEHYWAQGAMVSVSASARQIDGYTRNQTRLTALGWVSIPINDGKAHTRGLEFEAKFPLKSVLATAPALDLRLNVSRNWSSVEAVTGPNNRLDQQVPLSATVGVDYKAGRLTTGGSYAFRNGGLVKLSEQQSVYQSVRRDVEVYGVWKYDPRTQLRVAASNMLAQDYVSESNYLEPAGMVHRRTTSPSDIVLRATIEMKF